MKRYQKMCRYNNITSATSDKGSSLEVGKVLKFIEDNWNLGRIGGGSLDVLANPLNKMFDYRTPPHQAPLILNPYTGEKR